MSYIKTIKNIAIIAHVDHGKTTLVDQMLKQSGLFHKKQKVEERILDSNDLEKERGITILSKNTSIRYDGVKINIVDTPGHADFGGEVERIMKMVDGVLLLIDASEGPMPQTRFVWKKALEAGLKTIVVINKIDSPRARPKEVVDEVLDLFIDLEADESQLDFPVVYASAKEGIAKIKLEDERSDLKPLFDLIINEIPSPHGDGDKPLQMMISSIDYDNYVGRVGIGKIFRGSINKGQKVVKCNPREKGRELEVTKLYTFEGLKRVEKQQVGVGEIAAVSGIEDINIGDTLCSPDNIEPIPTIKIDEPTVSMNFMVNDSPFAGREGSFVTSRHLKERLMRELLSNVALKVDETESPDCFKVSGRGELHLAILIETMRREGYEFAVSKPEVIMKKIDGVLCEPIESLIIEVPEDYMGIVIEKVGERKGEMLDLKHNTGSIVKMEFKIPARGIIGFRSEFLTDTKGTGVMHHVFHGYEKYKGSISTRNQGSLIASHTGTATTYGLYNAQGRGTVFIKPGIEVYKGMIIGENSHKDDITINVCKKKHLTNIRAAGSDEALKLIPPRIMSLENALEFIAKDELVEVTPKNIRLRKKILDETQRLRARKK